MTKQLTLKQLTLKQLTPKQLTPKQPILKQLTLKQLIPRKVKCYIILLGYCKNSQARFVLKKTSKKFDQLLRFSLCNNSKQVKEDNEEGDK